MKKTLTRTIPVQCFKAIVEYELCFVVYVECVCVLYSFGLQHGALLYCAWLVGLLNECESPFNKSGWKCGHKYKRTEPASEHTVKSTQENVIDTYSF